MCRCCPDVLGYPFRGAAARRSRSLIASPSPLPGTGITAIPLAPSRAPSASSQRSPSNRRAAASTVSPEALSWNRQHPPGKRRSERQQRLVTRDRSPRSGAQADAARNATSSDPGSADPVPRKSCLRHVTLDRAEARLQVLDRNATRTQQDRDFARSGPARSNSIPTAHGPLSRTAAIRPSEPVQHVLRRGRADLSRTVGGGRRDRTVHGLKQGQRQGVARYPHRQRVQPGPGQQRDRTIRLARQHQGSAVPARMPPATRSARSSATTSRNAQVGRGVMTDQRIEPRSALGLENRGHSLRRSLHRRPGRRPFLYRTRRVRPRAARPPPALRQPCRHAKSGSCSVAITHSARNLAKPRQAWQSPRKRLRWPADRLETSPPCSISLSPSRPCRNPARSRC